MRNYKRNPCLFSWNIMETIKERLYLFLKRVVMVCPELDITLNDQHLGILHNMKSGWKMDEVKDKKLVDAIGQEVLLWYE